MTVLYFAGCPNWQTALDHINEAARQAGTEVRVTILAVETLDDANRVGFTGSPTIWVNAGHFRATGHGPRTGLPGVRDARRTFRVADRRPARCRPGCLSVSAEPLKRRQHPLKVPARS